MKKDHHVYLEDILESIQRMRAPHGLYIQP